MRIVVLALLLAVAASLAFGAEAVELPSRDGPIRAQLLRPPGAGPFPAIVALHGCAGIGTRSLPLRPIYRDWGTRWVEAGYAVVFPDSFGSRGAGPQCRARERRIRPAVERTRDAEAALAWLRAQPWVKSDRISLVGWSNGASTALWTVRAGNGGPARDGDFRQAIAFYPGCRVPAQRGWSARIPTLILIGEADDWTPAAACHDMVKQARGRSALVDIVGYPGAYHSFDSPNLPVRVRTGLAYTGNGSGTAHIGTNPAAREDAIRRVMQWLAR
ncbi:MAG: dienelactone hydrolase family protein [Rhizobiales bacterium]|nr:dienelactone hydrolase family protein [Hyphomicrobiales bacterium]